MPEANDEYVGTVIAGRLYGLSPDTLRRWIDAGYLPSRVTPTGHHRIRISDLDALMKPTNDFDVDEDVRAERTEDAAGIAPVHNDGAGAA